MEQSSCPLWRLLRSSEVQRRAGRVVRRASLPQEIFPTALVRPRKGQQNSLPSATNFSKLVSSEDFGVVHPACWPLDVTKITSSPDIVEQAESSPERRVNGTADGARGCVVAINYLRNE